MGVTIQNADGTVRSSAGSMSEEAARDVELANKHRFVLGRAIHLTASGKVVEEHDPLGIRVLGGAGSVISPADVEKYGLDDSYRLPAPNVVLIAEPAPIEPEVTEPPIEDVPKAVPEPAPAPEPAPSPEPQAEPESEQSRATHRRR